MTRIALDAMGGDKAPGEMVRGGIVAATDMKDVKVFLVGRRDLIDEACSKFEPSLGAKLNAALVDGRLEIVHAPDVAEMDEAPVDAVRHKKDCSINVAMRLVKEGRADCFVSAGNSGAVATSAILTLGRNGVVLFSTAWEYALPIIAN